MALASEWRTWGGWCRSSFNSRESTQHPQQQRRARTSWMASSGRYIGMATPEPSRRVRAWHSKAPLLTNWSFRRRHFFPPGGTAPCGMRRSFQRSGCCSPSWRKPSRPCSDTSSTSGVVDGDSTEKPEAWVLSDDVSWPCTFRRICDALGIDPDYLREGVMRWSARRRANVPDGHQPGFRKNRREPR